MMKMKMMIFLVMVFVWIPSTVFCGVVSETVSYEHGGKQLEGYLAWDDAVAGRRPGVLVVHEWWGLNDFARKQAEKLAALGYNVFALDMYGEGKVTAHPEKASEWSKKVTGNIESWRKRALAGLEVLKKDPRTDKSRIAAVGYCFGGSTVQQLAYAGADVAGVVSFHGSLISPPEDVTGGDTAKILICHGASDPMTKKAAIPGYISAMEESGIDWQMVMYGGAVHSFTNPGADAAGMDGVAYSDSADRRSWQHMQVFFDELF